MKCLRCNEEMKHYSIGTCISVFGAEKKHLGNIVQEEHSPPGGAILHIFPVFLSVLAPDIDRQPQGCAA